MAWNYWCTKEREARAKAKKCGPSNLYAYVKDILYIYITCKVAKKKKVKN